MRFSPFSRGDGDSPERIEIRETRRSQWYEDFKHFVKWVLKFAFVAGSLYLAYLAMDWYVFAGFLLAVPMFFFFFHYILSVPHELVLVCHISEDLKDDSDSIAIYSIPQHRLKEFKWVGGNEVKFSSPSGSVLVCDSIDFDKREIKAPWFADLSNIEFFRNKQAFRRLKDYVIELFASDASYKSLRSVALVKDFSEWIELFLKNVDADIREPEAIRVSFDEFLKDRFASGSNGEVKKGDILKVLGVDKNE